MSTIVTPAIAQAEIARRALPKGNRPKPARTEGALAAFAMSGADLKGIAGTDAPAPKATPAKATAKVGASKAARVANPHTLLRKAANEVKRAHFHVTGENLTYADACALFGTAPAGEGLDATTKVTKTMTSKAQVAIKDPAAFVAEVLV